MKTIFSNEGYKPTTIVDTLRRPRLWVPTETDYPGHGAWLEKVEADLSDGKKKAMVAEAEGLVVGLVVYQRDPSQPSTLEIKNISIAPGHRRRRTASFLVRSSEVEAAHTDFVGVDKVVVDTKPTNLGMVNFLLGQGYTVTGIRSLYGEGSAPDLIFEKQLLPALA